MKTNNFPYIMILIIVACCTGKSTPDSSEKPEPEPTAPPEAGSVTGSSALSLTTTLL